MLEVSLNPFRLVIREAVGIAHELQIIEIPIPPGSGESLQLRDEKSGQLHFVQRSRENPERGFLAIAIQPAQTHALVPAETGEIRPDPAIAVSTSETNGAWAVRGPQWEIELSIPADAQDFPNGPIRRFRRAGGPWRGRTFFDLNTRTIRSSANWIERGPLRSVYLYRAEFDNNRFYEVTITADAGLDFVRLHERFRGASSDQIVWDFAGDDLPEQLSLLDSTAAYTARGLHYHLDQRHARLWCWTQFSQLHDLSDGFALHFSGADDVVGLVTLEGGQWQGNALNHLEAWTRRWQTADPTTRRLPADAKADSFPGIDAIPARGSSLNAPHFTLEGWLKEGERRFALVLTTRQAITPLVESEGAKGETGCSVELGHFETKPRRDLYSRLQSRLRKIHIQYGLLPLQDQLAQSVVWPEEKNFAGNHSAFNETHQLAWDLSRPHNAPPDHDDPDSIRQIDEFLQTRVFGFWEGSGAAYSNCVVSRRVGPDMLQFEKLSREGRIPREQAAQWRAWFAFLAHLNFSDNFYPGASSMEPVGTPNSFDPVMAGMANQNFYTDIIMLFGMAGQVFAGNPSATAWRDKFVRMWRRQLEYHMYPKSGVWEESHTYYQHVLQTVLPLLLRRRADGADDIFADANMQKLVAGALPQFTPRNAVVGGARHMVPFGDHGVDVATYRDVYKHYALAFAQIAPALAGQLAWAYREMGGKEDPGIAPVAPELKTERLEGLGFFFRNRDASGDESLLALRSGMAWGHHHTDDGSIQFYAKGRALITDSASAQPQERGERKFLTPGHSRTVPEGLEPITHFWRFNRGWILDSRATGNLNYAVAGTPLFSGHARNLPTTPYTRAVWQLRAIVELAPAVYLIADYLDKTLRHYVRFHVAHQEVAMQESRVTATFAPDCHLAILPLTEVKPPSLSQDRPTNKAKLPQEITTAVEYADVPGGWSLFVLAALNSPDALSHSSQDGTTRISVAGREAGVRLNSDVLQVENDQNEPVSISASTLLTEFRRQSR
jgi:hypothetical protein